MQRAIRRQPFDRRDLGAVLHHGKREAGIDPRPSTSTVQAPHWP
jgi:hypothetical protein